MLHLAISSTEILEEQLSFENEDLEVEVMLVNVEEEERDSQPRISPVITTSNMLVEAIND